MTIAKRWLLAFLLGLLLPGIVITHAQDALNGALVAGQPAISQIAIAGEKARFAYSLNQISQVTIQALSDAIHPTITVLRDGRVVAQQSNSATEPMVVLNAVLDAGAYIVEIGALEGATGTVIALIQSETPVIVMNLFAGSMVTGEVSATSAIALYSFSALPEASYVYYESLNPVLGAIVQLLNVTTGQDVATLGAGLTGGRLRIPAGNNLYRLQFTYTGVEASIAYTVCFASVSGSECEQGGGSVVVPVATPADQTVISADDACVVSPKFAGGANIRQSASTNAPIITALVDGTTAKVLGIDPTSSWYNVEYNGIMGWAALSAVQSAGNCAGLPIVIPPPVPPTAVPPTITPVPVPPTATPSGPCLITFTAPELIYTVPLVDPSNIFDQIPAGGELIPVGRANVGGQDWWKTNYFGAWWLNAPGTAGIITGDCGGLPFITP